MIFSNDKGRVVMTRRDATIHDDDDTTTTRLDATRRRHQKKLK